MHWNAAFMKSTMSPSSLMVTEAKSPKLTNGDQLAHPRKGLLAHVNKGSACRTSAMAFCCQNNSSDARLQGLPQVWNNFTLVWKYWEILGNIGKYSDNLEKISNGGKMFSALLFVVFQIIIIIRAGQPQASQRLMPIEQPYHNCFAD